MAQQPNRLPEYRTNGSAAYDVHRLERKVPVRKPRPKAKLEIAPGGIVMLLVAVGAILLVLFSYMRMFEVKSEIADLNTEVTRAEQKNGQLMQQYQAGIKLDVVQKRARELCMTTPSKAQTVYLCLDSKTDWAEVTAPKSPDLLESIFTGLRRSFEAMLEFFS